MAKKKQAAKSKIPASSRRAPVVWIGLLALAVVVGGVALWWANGGALSLTPTAAPPSQLGGVTSCRRLPGFVAAQGFDPATAALSTSDDRRMGLLLVEP
ncbi:MAG: hypothetical protein ACT4QE_04370, partial [Anaerolineales bacterium]